MLDQYRQAIGQHRARIYSFAHYSLRAKEDAEDVTQEVFIKLWQHWQKIDHSKLGGWLMRVTHNAVIDHVRKQKPSQIHLDRYADVDQQSTTDDQAKQLDQRAFKDQWQVAIKALADPFRSIMIMRDVQGLSYADIQISLGMSESQVKVYLHRGRRKLRDNPNLRRLFDSYVKDETQSNKVVATGARQAANDKGKTHAK